MTLSLCFEVIVDNFDVVWMVACVRTNDRIKNNEKSVVVTVGMVDRCCAIITQHFDQRRKMWCTGTSMDCFLNFSVWRGRS